MKRDMDLIRELLLRLEVLPLRGGMRMVDASTAELAVAEFSEEQVDYHLDLLRKAHLLQPTDIQTMSGAFAFRGLSWEGHDFADSVRDPEIWAKTKSGAIAAGGFTVDLLLDLAKGFIKKKVEQLTGVPL